MDVKAILNSPAMWLCCSGVMITLLGMAAYFLKMSWSEAKRRNIDKSRLKDGVRAAAITAIGPSLANILIVITLVATIGAPNTWMRSNDVGAPRTELSRAGIYAEMLGESVGSDNFTIDGAAFMLIALSITVVGWMIATMILTPNMGRAITVLEKKYNPKLIKTIMGTSSFGVFCYLLTSNTVGKGSYLYPVAALVGACVVFAINKIFAKNKTVKQLGLGIAILVGVIVAGVLKAVTA